MYIPDVFRDTNPETAYALIEEIRLGSLISYEGGLQVSHLPFMIDRSVGPRGRLIGHCAIKNPQWKSLDYGSRVLATFLSPNAYVSPGWYRSHPRAPTWLYASVHIEGTATLIRDPDAIKAMAVQLSHEMDPPGSNWSPEMIGDYIERLLPQIIGFHIDVTNIQTQLRLAQQNGREDRQRVYDVLNRGDLSQRLVAMLIERYTARDAH